MSWALVRNTAGNRTATQGVAGRGLRETDDGSEPKLLFVLTRLGRDLANRVEDHSLDLTGAWVLDSPNQRLGGKESQDRCDRTAVNVPVADNQSEMFTVRLRLGQPVLDSGASVNTRSASGKTEGLMVATNGSERFENGAKDYAAYLETPEGQLRADLVFANLQDFLPRRQSRKAMCALDVGCGTGASAVRLARLGFHVTQLDSSQAMLDIARRTAEEAGVSNRVTLQQGDAAQLTNLFRAASFDVILCHNLLEYVDDPASVLRGAARALRDTPAILSIVVRNQAGEVFKTAIQAGDLAAAEAKLTAEWGIESLYGGRVRLFTPTDLRAMLNAESMAVLAERGVRVLADYLPPQISRSSEYTRILELEKKLGSRPEYANVARYIHCLARRRENGV